MSFFSQNRQRPQPSEVITVNRSFDLRKLRNSQSVVNEWGGRNEIIKEVSRKETDYSWEERE